MAVGAVSVNLWKADNAGGWSGRAQLQIRVQGTSLLLWHLESSLQSRDWWLVLLLEEFGTGWGCEGALGCGSQRCPVAHRVGMGTAPGHC